MRELVSAATQELLSSRPKEGNKVVKVRLKNLNSRAVSCGAATIAVLAACGCAFSPEAKEARFIKTGKEYLAKKDYGRAILQFKSAVKVKPNDAEPYYQLGLAGADSGDPDMAVRAFWKAVELNPKHSGAQVRLSELMAATRERDLVEQAHKRLSDVLTQAPGNMDALRTLALTEWKLGKLGDADQHLQTVLTTAPKDLKAAISLSQVKAAQKDIKGAEEVLKKAAAQQPPSADAAVALAEFYVMTKRVTDAEQQFRRALDRDPKNGFALMDLAALLARSGRRAQAEEIYRRLSALPVKRFKPLHAVFLFESGKRDLALTEFQKLVKDDSNDRDARSRLVAAYLQLNRPMDAERLLDDALHKNSKDTEALVQRAGILMMFTRQAEAEKDLVQALHWQPDSALAHYLLSRIHQTRGATFQQRTELDQAVRLDRSMLRARLELAQNLIASNAAKAAVSLLDETPTFQRKSIAVIEQRNWALAAAGERVELRKGIDEGLALTRTQELLLQDAFLKLLQQNIAGSRASLDEILKQNPKNLKALELLAMSYASQKQTSMAVEKIRPYAEKATDSAPIQQLWGEWLLRTGDRKRAREAFQLARKADPNLAPAVVELTKLDATEGKMGAARANLAGYVTAHPANSSTRLLLANLDELAGEHSSAIEHYRKVLETEPNNVRALNNLAYDLASYSNESDEALKRAQRALELAPDQPGVKDTMGWVLYKKGLYPAAIRYLEDAAAKQGPATLEYHLAMAYFRAGDRKNGQRMLEAALAKDARLPEAQMARQVRDEMAGTSR